MKSMKWNITFTLIVSSMLISCNQAAPRTQSDALPLRSADMNEHTYSMREDITPAQEFIMAQILEAATNVDGVDRAIAYSRSNFDVTIGIQGGNDTAVFNDVRDSVKRIAPNYKVNVVPYGQVKMMSEGSEGRPLYNPMDQNLQHEIKRRLR